MTTFADEADFYEARLDELRRGQLKTVQASAGRWSALMTAVLGVFGTVAFAGGLTTIDDLAEPFDAIAKAVTTLAAAAAVVAVVYLARASGGLRLDDLAFPNGRTLMNREAELTAAARTWLRTGRWFAAATGALVLWCPTATPGPSNVLVRFPDGALAGQGDHAGAVLLDRLQLGQVVLDLPVTGDDQQPFGGDARDPFGVQGRRGRHHARRALLLEQHGARVAREGDVRAEPGEDAAEAENVGVDVEADLRGLDPAHAARAAFS